MTFDNPVFVTYVIAASLMVLKVMGQGWMTVVRMMKVGGGFLNPEDESKGWTNPKPRPGQLDPDDYVERSRRMHRNDLENIPIFLIAGLLFVLTEPVLWVAQLLFFGFVAARLLHFWAYLTAKPHEVRATFFTIGSLIVIGMAVFTLAYAII
ncbi:MAG: MAPEG family protein [Acidobacteria bacterium]|nr:MAPEG family protein [Acidobacteriota bacterium]